MGFELNINLFTTEMPITTCVNPHPLSCLLHHQAKINGRAQLLVPNLCRGWGGGLERSLKPNSVEHDSDKGKRKMQNKQSGTGCKVDLQISINQSINQLDWYIQLKWVFTYQ